MRQRTLTVAIDGQSDAPVDLGNADSFFDAADAELGE